MPEEKEAESKDDEAIPEGINILWLILLLACVIGLWVGSYYIVRLKVHDLSDSGSIGDTFGIVNSLFSGLAFAGLIFAILLQRKEISLQRIDLKQTHVEMGLARETVLDTHINKKQNK